METVTIHTEYIKVSQLLKLASLVGQGSDVKIFLAEGLVTLNGQTISERGKKIHPGDVVEVKGYGSVKVEAE